MSAVIETAARFPEALALWMAAAYALAAENRHLKSRGDGLFLRAPVIGLCWIAVIVSLVKMIALVAP